MNCSHFYDINCLIFKKKPNIKIKGRDIAIDGCLLRLADHNPSASSSAPAGGAHGQGHPLAAPRDPQPAELRSERRPSAAPRSGDLRRGRPRRRGGNQAVAAPGNRDRFEDRCSHDEIDRWNPRFPAGFEKRGGSEEREGMQMIVWRVLWRERIEWIERARERSATRTSVLVNGPGSGLLRPGSRKDCVRTDADLIGRTDCWVTSLIGLFSPRKSEENIHVVLKGLTQPRGDLGRSWQFL